MLSSHDLQTLRREVKDEPTTLLQAFNALSDASRFRIFILLSGAHDLCVTDIAHVLGMSVPAASQQLKVLELSGLISRERQGQRICYCVKSSAPLVRAVTRLISLHR